MDQAKPRFASTEEKLKAMRSGYKVAHELKYGDYIIPVRVLAADEESRIYAQARIDISKIPSLSQEMKEAAMPLENMKLILMHASTIGSDQHLPRTLLDLLTAAELQAIYEGYLDICCEVDPNFVELSQSEITEIVMEVKKSPSTVKGLSTRQLKGIGHYFLEKLLPMVSAAGGL